MRYLKIFSIAVFFFLFLALPSSSYAQSPKNDEYIKARVVEILDEKTTDTNGYENITQTIKIVLLEGPQRGKSAVITQGGLARTAQAQLLKKNDDIVVQSTLPKNNLPAYVYVDKFRLTNITWILGAFFALVILIAGKKGVGAIGGLILSLGIIMYLIVPQILMGRDPLLITIAGSLLIMVSTMYLAHGPSKKTTVAVMATLCSLIISGLLGIWFVGLAKLTGLGNEEAYLLQFGETVVNAKGMLLSGIIIGTLGVLDDVTSSQTAAVFELHRANKTLGTWELFKRGYRIGQEHVTSLVNTLVLAYAGASLSLFIIFVLNPTKLPIWMMLNSETVQEEVVRTIAGSIGLVLAVPIATMLAAWVVNRSNAK